MTGSSASPALTHTGGSIQVAYGYATWETRVLVALGQLRQSGRSAIIYFDGRTGTFQIYGLMPAGSVKPE